MKKFFAIIVFSLTTLTSFGQDSAEVSRPQEPMPKFPYYIEDLKFNNPEANISLAGTLNRPFAKGKYPAVVLISGSGAQNRDEEILGHKPFLIISDYLARNGIAVLRYDDRGTAQSEGDFAQGTTHDFASDAKAAVNYLKTRKDIDTKQIGVIGHSEGGTIAFILAAENNSSISFVVSLAGAALSGDSILYLQNKSMAESMGMSEAVWQIQAKTLKDIYATVKNAKNCETAKIDLTSLFTKMYSQQIVETENVQKQINAFTTKWTTNFLSYDPAVSLAKVKCPVFALNGEKDIQVMADSNLGIIEKTLKDNGNEDVTIKKYPELNHLFQHCTTGMPNEYAKIEETISPEVLQDIKDWIISVTQKRK